MQNDLENDLIESSNHLNNENNMYMKDSSSVLSDMKKKLFSKK